ncbi:Calmin [Merluccius polli]|uniref:Calmin n=1 Tax=Merluccius polli TaxID=89951 RepID=A0AA47N021_MERPO|nr:Calmin [Merluccius polli]
MNGKRSSAEEDLHPVDEPPFGKVYSGLNCVNCTSSSRRGTPSQVREAWDYTAHPGCDPPTEVQDLFRDIQDGRVLMALLEELSGCKLLHGFKKSSHRIFRLNNIAKVLTFLEERNVKLVSIDAADIADGNSSIILGLIWNIILFFQIKELTGNIRSQFPSTSSLSSIPTSSDSDTSHSSTPSEERRAPSTAGHAGHGRAIKKLLQWECPDHIHTVTPSHLESCPEQPRSDRLANEQLHWSRYGVAVQDFGKSWTSGLAFLAVIKSIDPSLVDMRRALLRSPRENLEEAFRTAHYTLGIPRLLEPEDVTISRPEEQCIMTYVSQFLEHFPGIEEPEQPSLVIERSVSMGRLNTCDLDSDHQVKNSLDRSRLKKRPCTADKDWPQHPPPRIFLSSVSEDRGVAVSLTHNPSRAGARSWASEDSLLDPGPSADADGEPRDPEVTEVFTVSTARSPQPLYVHSPVGSPSAIGDSAIGSPESWQEDSRWGESPSNGSLCDSGTTWDVGVSHAEEATTPNEGLTPSSVDTLPDEQLMPELFVDEGVYSLSSIESTKERIQSQLETEQEEGETGQANLDFNKSLWVAMHVPEEKTDENKAEQEHEGMNGGQLEMGRDSVEEPLSLKCCNGTEKVISEDGSSSEPVEVDRSRPDLNTNLLTSHLFLEFKEQNSVEASSQGDNEGTEKAIDPSGVIEGQSPAETTLESHLDEPEVKAACQSKYYSLEDREEMETLEETNKEAFQNSQTQVETNEGGFNGHTDVQENTGSEILESHEYSHLEQMAWALDDVSQQDSLCSSNHESYLSESGAIVNAEIVDVEEEPVSLCDLYFDLTSTVNAEVGLPAEPTESNLVLLGGDLTDPPNLCQETLNAASISVVGTGPDGDGPDEAESCDSGAHAKVSPAHETSIQHTGMGLFYTNIDSSLQSEELFGEALEPMDLFYPDKEDVMLTDPAEADTEFLPSVFGVFALQPAPVSEPLLPDIDHTWEETDVGNPKVPDEDYDNGEKLAMEKMEEGVDKELESRQLSGSAPKLPMDVTGGMGPAEQVGPTEDGHLSRDDGEGKMQSIAKGNTEPMSDEEHSGRPGEDLLPTVLRHRKAPGVFNSSDKQMIVPIIKINSTNADLGEGPLQDRELYLILLLWLLLYCLWLLPQMELRALPSLLFNLDH